LMARDCCCLILSLEMLQAVELLVWTGQISALEADDKTGCMMEVVAKTILYHVTFWYKIPKTKPKQSLPLFFSLFP
jgi:hypothetical protein